MNSALEPNIEKRKCVIRSRLAGFFSNVHGVLGALDECEKRGDELSVLFDTGFYLCPGHGPNWWEYFFEPIGEGNPFALPLESNWHKMSTDWSFSGKALNRHRACDLFHRYCTVLPHLVDEINEFIRRQVGASSYIAVQLRGTDKRRQGCVQIQSELLREQIELIDARIGSKCPIFVATDEHDYLSMMKESNISARLFYLNAVRSFTRKPIHVNVNADQGTNGFGYKLGKEALMDCIILSRSSYFLWTSSNLSECALKWNPNLEGLNLTELQKERTSRK